MDVRQSVYNLLSCIQGQVESVNQGLQELGVTSEELEMTAQSPLKDACRLSVLLNELESVGNAISNITESSEQTQDVNAALATMPAPVAQVYMRKPDSKDEKK